MYDENEKNNGFEVPQTPEDFKENSSTYLAALKDPKNWTSIPMLNYIPLHKLKDYDVVRFRGMIQDMQDPEIYLERYKVKSALGTERIQDGKYRDCLLLKSDEHADYDDKDNVQGERRTLFLVSIPGINHWAHDYEEKCNSKNLPCIMTDNSSNRSNAEGFNKKRSAPSDEEATMAVDSVLPNTSEWDSNKRQCVREELSDASNTDNKNSMVLGAEYLLNSPIPERPGKACMVKIYDDFDTHMLNSIVDVVGFLSVDPALDASTMDVDDCPDFGNTCEIQARNPPPSLIPRLHAIAVHQLPHLNPLCDERFLPIAVTNDQNSVENFNMLSVRNDLRMLLTLCLFNDALAADYLLSHLISTVYCRSDLECIGKFTLNVCNLPKKTSSEYTRKLYGILELLIPASHYLPMTLNTMNTTTFIPKKDYETNKLVSGLLQLAPHTHLVLDETVMQEGKMESNGVLGVQALTNLIKEQQIKCNFQYFDINYNVNIPVLILSEGRSMLPSDFLMPIKTDAHSIELIDETVKAAHHYLQPSRLDQFRRFLTKAKTSSFRLNDAESEMVQNDFIQMRKAKKLNSIDNFHNLLVLSRLLAISQGKDVLDKESWELAKSMEEEREQRVREMSQS